jgi:hypothetical protein
LPVWSDPYSDGACTYGVVLVDLNSSLIDRKICNHKVSRVSPERRDKG